MRNLKRLLCLVLSLALVLSIAGLNNAMMGASADSFNQSLVNQFTDIKGHWANDGLTNLIGYGYMKGVGDNQAAPNDTLTTAQLVALLVRIMGGSEEADLSGYVDMNPKAWYYSEIAQGLNMGIIPNTNTNYINPNQEASREYASYMLCRAFGLTVRAPLDDFTDADKVSDWAVSSMQAMVAAEAIVGTNGRYGRTLNPQETITRAEFAQMVYRLVHDFVQITDSTNIRKQTFEGGLLVSRSGVTLRDCTIKGNLYVADAVGTGDITLENVTVEGNIYARGCGERSVHLEGTTKANSVVFINPYHATRLVVEDEAEITGVLVNNGADEVTLEGNVGNVTLNVSDVDLTFENATASTVIINSANSTITVDKDSVLDTMSIASSSSGVTVDSKGKINRLAQMANDAKLNLDGTLEYLLIGAVSNLDLDLDSGITLGALDLHCSDSTISVNCDVKSISVSAFSDKLKLNLGKTAKVVSVGISSATTDLTVHNEATVGAVTIDAPKYKGTVSSDLTNLIIGAGATEAEVTLAKDTDIDTMTINGSKVKVIVSSGATVNTMNVTGKEANISGQGKVSYVNVATTAEGTAVTTGDTAVANAGADKVTAGGIEVPANKTYTTTSAGKDVIRNNDGTPDGDGDKTTGAGDEVATVANFELSFAGSATASDIHSSGKWTLNDLGSDISLTKNVAGTGATYKLTGNVKKVDNFSPVHDAIAGYGTGYYVPVVVSADSMATETDWTITSGGYRYTKANVSTGTAYPGKMILFVQLQSGITSKVAYVTFDRDGNGDKYSPVTVSIDYSAVTFDGAQDFTGEILSYPVNATTSDLTSNGNLDLKSFGNFALSKSGTNNSYVVTGTANYVAAEVKGNTGVVPEGTHHYLPLMINTSGFKSGWTVVLGDGTRFSASNVSRGEGCRGHLVMLLPLNPTNRTTTIYLDTDGDGYTDANGTYVINCNSVGLGDSNTTTPPTGDGDANIGTVPAGLTVKLDTNTWIATITDNAGLIESQPEAQRNLYCVNAVKAQMKADGYTGISHTEGNGGKTYYIAGTKDGTPCTFTWGPDTGITVPKKTIDVNYVIKTGVKGQTDKSGKVTLNEGDTVEALITEVDGVDVDLGGYFIYNDSYVAIARANTVALKEGDTVTFGYYRVTAPSSNSISLGGVTVEVEFKGITGDGEEYYLPAGSIVDLGFTVKATGSDPIDTAGIISFVATGAEVALAEADGGLKLDSSEKAFDVAANDYLKGISLQGKSTVIVETVAEKTVTEVTFGAMYVLSDNVVYTLETTPVSGE